MKRILITGANGLLGQAITSLFKRESDFDLLQSSVEDAPFLDIGLDYIKMDITNKEEVKKTVNKYSPDVILNCAAFTDVDKCETEREQCWRLNVDAIKNLIISARPNNLKIIHYSTDYIFDGKNGPYKEDSIPHPISFYGRSKLASENALIISGVDSIIIRTMVLFGVGIKVKSNFALWMVNNLRNNTPINIVDDMIGNSTMVDDLAYGTLKALERDARGIYNITGADIISRFDFAMILCDVFNFNKTLVRKIKTKDLNQPALRPLNSGLITYKAETELGFKPMDTLEGLRLFKYQLGF
jgi:dTDP-4-dehydrorhamnose reductase